MFNSAASASTDVNSHVAWFPFFRLLLSTSLEEQKKTKDDLVELPTNLPDSGRIFEWLCWEFWSQKTRVFSVHFTKTVWGLKNKILQLDLRDKLQIFIIKWQPRLELILFKMSTAGLPHVHFCLLSLEKTLCRIFFCQTWKNKSTIISECWLYGVIQNQGNKSQK